MKQLAIIGPTASGKSDLAISVAQKIDAYILSIDSLSIYKEVDIVSAKPSKSELATVRHFGIDELYINEYFSVEVFIELYKKVVQQCQKDGKNLVIVGGTSFYLKTLLDGLSILPTITTEVQQNVVKQLENLASAHAKLTKIDPKYMAKIAPNDRYRIEKALLILEASDTPPSEWFNTHPPQPVITDLPIFNIDVERTLLRERIIQRTHKMEAMGLVDEVGYLEHKYTRAPNPMKAIGIVEVLAYLDDKLTRDEMIEQIIIHTAQLAKRQQTFNKTQFNSVTNASLDKLETIILTHIT